MVFLPDEVVVDRSARLIREVSGVARDRRELPSMVHYRPSRRATVVEAANSRLDREVVPVIQARRGHLGAEREAVHPDVEGTLRPAEENRTANIDATKPRPAAPKSLTKRPRDQAADDHPNHPLHLHAGHPVNLARGTKTSPRRTTRNGPVSLVKRRGSGQ